MELLILFFLLAVTISFLCSILEAVLLSTTPAFIQVQLDKRRHGAGLLKKNKEQIDLSISAILTVNTFAHTIGASGVGAEAMVIFGEEHMLVISAILTLAILYLSEIVPKVIGATHWQKLAIPAAYLIRLLVIITYPLLLISSLITRIFRKEAIQKTSREEIKAISELGSEEGILDEQESGIIGNLLNLRQAKVRDILTPRSVLFSLNQDMTVEAFFAIEDFDNFSRIPVYDQSIDNITGVVLLRHILIEKYHGNGERKLSEIALPVFTINENIPVSKALELFIKRREHIFIVNDRYDQTQGVVTLEDAIETLLGVEIINKFVSVITASGTLGVCLAYTA